MSSTPASKPPLSNVVAAAIAIAAGVASGIGATLCGVIVTFLLVPLFPAWEIGFNIVTPLLTALAFGYGIGAPAGALLVARMISKSGNMILALVGVLLAAGLVVGSGRALSVLSRVIDFDFPFLTLLIGLIVMPVVPVALFYLRR